MESNTAEKLQRTRVYLQDISKIIGKVQQVVLSPQPHDWHKGLVITHSGLSSQELAHNLRIDCNFGTGTITAGKDSWQLAGKTSLEILQSLTEWVKTQSTIASLALPELSSHSSAYDVENALFIAQLNYQAQTILTGIKARLSNGLTSPILLYPHHFDVSFVWYPGQPTNKNDDHQYTYGFSNGDEYIAEPYYYVTEYQESKAFKLINLPLPAYWHNKGFSGAVLTHNEASKQGATDALINKFYEAVLNSTV